MTGGEARRLVEGDTVVDLDGRRHTVRDVDTVRGRTVVHTDHGRWSAADLRRLTVDELVAEADRAAGREV